MALLPSLGRAWYALRFRLFDRRRHQTRVRERIDGLDLEIGPEVFHPALFFSSRVLAEAMRRELGVEDRSLLDLGCGSGYLALRAARETPALSRVLGVDLSPDAVLCARGNAARNAVVPRVEVRQGDLFGPVGREQFDLIVMNPPYLEGEVRRPWDLSWVDQGGVVGRLARSAAGHLTERGRLLLLGSSLARRSALEPFAAPAWDSEVAARRRLWSGEVLTVWRLRPRS